MSGYDAAAGGWHPQTAGKEHSQQHHSVSSTTEKPWPPYAASATWRRGRLLLILTGSAGRLEAARRVESDRRWGDYAPPMALLPFGKAAQRYRWDFAAGRHVAIKVVGERETNVSLLHLVRLVLEAGAAIIAVPLSGDRLELFRRSREGEIWRLS